MKKKIEPKVVIFKNREDRLAYACDLIETSQAEEESPMRIAEATLTILEFGKITTKEFLFYIEATGR